MQRTILIISMGLIAIAAFFFLKFSERQTGNIHNNAILTQQMKSQNPYTFTLPALILMKLTSFRHKDQMHLLDMIDVGLIDLSSVATVPAELAPRLQELIDNPES